MPGLDQRVPIRRPAVARRRLACAGAVVVLAGGLAAMGAGAGGAVGWTQTALSDAAPLSSEPDGHLLVSEVMAGGASASDEFIEIYNPTAAALPLEGLELVYVSASGATVSRKAEWPAGAASLMPGTHLLVANEAGVFAAIADATYANGLAATGGSVALRIQGGATAIDAVGWGSAASAWMEGTPAPAVAASHSLERLPGGTEGSGQDTDDNILDFFDQPAPDPQNAAAPPISVSPPPSASGSTVPSPSQPLSEAPSATASASPSATATPATPTPSASPTPTVVSVATARALPDGSWATIQGISLTDGGFADGGGYVADETGGIAVLVSNGTFARGQLLRVTGEIDDRFHQRTIRAEATDVVPLGPAGDPAAASVLTGQVGEVHEGNLVRVSGQVVSSATQLSGAVAYDLDDGSGPARLVVMDSAAIDQAWERGTLLELVAVVGQRDSSGTGSEGYRLLPRDPADLLSATPSASASPTASASTSPGTSPSPGPSHDPSVVSIAQARQAPINARVRVRGVVTLPSSLLHDGTAALQDGSGAIVLRLGDEAGHLALGELVQVDGVRSTKSGMETLRVSEPPLRLGSQAQPEASRHATGSLGERQEGLLVVARGAVVSSPRRSSAENVYFDLDDGSGPLRVYLSPRAGVDAGALALGAWVEITGVLGQETSGQQPQRGHRLWPRVAGDVRLIAAATGTGGSSTESPGGSSGAAGGGGGGPRPGTYIPGGSPRPVVALPVPGLTAAPAGRGSLETEAPSGQPSPDPAPVLARARADGLAPLLALAAALLGGAAALASARPGLTGRLRALALPSRLDGSADGEAASGFPLERTVARLVPLAVMDDGGGDERASSTASRSPVRRILPPT